MCARVCLWHTCDYFKIFLLSMKNGRSTNKTTRIHVSIFAIFLFFSFSIPFFSQPCVQTHNRMAHRPPSPLNINYKHSWFILRNLAHSLASRIANQKVSLSLAGCAEADGFGYTRITRESKRTNWFCKLFSIRSNDHRIQTSRNGFH